MDQFLRGCSLLTIIASLYLSGCNTAREVWYFGEETEGYYRSHATQIDYPNVSQPLPETVVTTEAPRTIDSREHWEARDITLLEAMQIALQNNEIFRSAGTFQSIGGGVLAGGDRVASVYDPAIQESGVLFGGRGVEAALAAFDANFQSTMTWGRNETILNNVNDPLNSWFRNSALETGVFTSSLSKSFAHGGFASINHDISYSGTNSQSANVLYPSSYNGILEAEYQLPLLAGAGAAFTRTAGPINQSFGGISGVSQGVVIARINNDISLADFDLAVRSLTKDVEDVYWDLYLAYRKFDTAIDAYTAAQATWQISDTQLREGALSRADAAQARDALFSTKAAADDARSAVYTGETRFRRLLGLPVNDGTYLRPAEEPVTAELVPDWYSSLSESLTKRVELRKQKWNIKSLELQLRAANSLTKPRLDGIAKYRVNGFGDRLIGGGGNPPGNDDNFYGSITDSNQTGWALGLQFNWDIGFRSALAQVRNYEIRLAKAQQLLQVQEEEVAHELAASFQELARAYNAAKMNLNRFLAAEENVKYLEPAFRERDILLDVYLRAQSRRAEAEVAYYQSLVEYNKAITALMFRQGSILEHNNIQLMEGPWTPEAEYDASRRYYERAYGTNIDEEVYADPEEFASPYPIEQPVIQPIIRSEEAVVEPEE